MEKIIWFFGEPGSGKKDLIKNIIENKNNTRELLNIDSNNISVIEETVKRDDSLSNHDELKRRCNDVCMKINKSIEDNNNIILVFGHYSDTNGTLVNIANSYPNIDKEIVFLNPSNLDILYERMKNTEWFKSDYEKNIKRYPREWLDISITHLQKQLYKHEEYGYTITEIDTTDGYEIKNKNNQKIR